MKLEIRIKFAQWVCILEMVNIDVHSADRDLRSTI